MNDREFWVFEEPPSRCVLCSKVAETRPYGPGGVEVCFACGMRNEDEAKRRFAARVEEPAS